MAVTVNGVEISAEAIQEEVDALREDYKNYIRQEGGVHNEAQLREWAIEDLIENHLFREAAIASQPLPSEERVRNELVANSALYDKLPEDQSLARASAALQQRRMMKEIRKGAKAPDELAVRAYYDEHPEVFVAPEALMLSHICRFVKMGDKAQIYLDLLALKSALENRQTDWDSALPAHSDTYGKDYGMFARVVRGDMPQEAEDKIWKLGEGAVSDVIDLGMDTLHLFKVMQRFESRKLKYNEVKDELRKNMFEEACADLVYAKLDELKAAAVIDRGQ